MKPWKSRKYLNTARGERCVLCGANDGTVVACHLPHTGYGMAAGTGQKTHDWLVAHCCITCHQRLDSGDWRNDYQMRMRALCLTLERAFESETLGVMT